MSTRGSTKGHGNGGRSPAFGILAGLGFFVSAGLCWSLIAGLVAWAVHLDPSESWWQRVGYFLVFFLPGPALAFAAHRLSGRISGHWAARVTLYASLAILTAAFVMLALLYPY